jgi:hypothetical protein
MRFGLTRTRHVVNAPSTLTDDTSICDVSSRVFSDEHVEKVAIEKTKRLARRLANEPEMTTTITFTDDANEDDKWDCQTILTTYSNIYNHPKLIAQIPKKTIRLSAKTGLPVTDKQRTTTKQEKKVDVSDDDDDDDDDDDRLSTGTSHVSFERKKGETSEERRARKHAVKDMRRVSERIVHRTNTDDVAFRFV